MTSGIGTHSQIGAQFGYGLGWTYVLSFRCRRDRACDRAGIARNLRRHDPQPVFWTMVAQLLSANIVSLGGSWSLTAFSQDLNNEKYNAEFSPGGFVFKAKPRVYGLEFVKRF